MVQNGIPAKYGGFETFVEELTAHQSNKNLKYHVACLSNGIQENFNHNDADCFNISKKNIGPANAIYYDLAALKYSLKEIVEKKNHRNGGKQEKTTKIHEFIINV